MYKVSFIALVVVASFALADAQQQRIVNGTTVEITKHPHQVALLHRPGTDDELHFGGGSLIGDIWVLSAVHMFKNTRNTRAARFAARVGSSSPFEDGTLIDIVGLSFHPKYDPKTQDYDFSLLKLRKPYTIDPIARAIAFVDADEVVADGTVCTASGWGNTLGTAVENSFQDVEVPIVNQEKCTKNYAETRLTITENMLCAGYDEGMRDACVGDSGGPLVCDGKLVGVISWGKGCAQKNYYGVYARIAKVRGWIKEKTGL